jgi:thermitase
MSKEPLRAFPEHLQGRGNPAPAFFPGAKTDYNKTNLKKMKTRVKTILLAVLCVALLLPLNVSAALQSADVQPLQDADFVPGELIVIMEPGNSVSTFMNSVSAASGRKVHAAAKNPKGLEKLNAGVINVPAGEESAYIAQLKKQPGVRTVEPNYIVHADMIPNDPAYATDQYGPALIQAPTAWDTTTGSSSVIIAIIDSGLDDTHPEFAGRVVPGHDFVEDDDTPQDECGHGTHVAGIAAATGNNATGIAGIAWGVKIMPLRALNEFCSGSAANIATAFIWAADHGARVINLSLGVGAYSTVMDDASYYAYSRGSAVFAAAGNSGISPVFYPAAYPQVMAIGAVDSSATRWSSSNYGTDLDLVAPGVSIYSTTPMSSGFFYNMLYGISTEYDSLNGTSMASPHAAGAAALLASMPGSCFSTPAQIYQALEDSALDLETTGWDQNTGYGLIQIADAMLECPPAPPVLTSFTTEYDLVTSQNCSPLVQYNWRDASSGTQELSVGNSSSDLISLPFTFDFGGQSYTSIRAHANGFISLGDNNTEISGGNYQTNYSLEMASKPSNIIAPFWDDLTDDSGTGKIYTRILGTTPNREFVIEYWNFKRVSAPSGSLSFEVILSENSNNIKMQYSTLVGSDSDGSSATVGLRYGNTSIGFAGYEYSYDQSNALQSGLALLFIPYTGGDPTLPSNAVCPQTEAVTVNSGDAHACNATSAAFGVDIDAGKLTERSVLKVQQLSTVPASSMSYLDLQHYADISLAYSPPWTSQTLPEVDVCYEYTPADVLAAGGHPENLFLTAHNKTSDLWQMLPTTVDTVNSRLFATAPHFSYYGVATLKPSTSSPGGSKDVDALGFPVTGGPVSREFLVFLIVLGSGLILVPGGIWLRKRKQRKPS